MQKRHYKYMTDKEFRKLKNLIDGGLSIQLIGEQTGRSRETLNRVAKVNTFQEYKDLVSAKNGTKTQTFPKSEGQPGVRKPVKAEVSPKCTPPTNLFLPQKSKWLRERVRRLLRALSSKSLSLYVQQRSH